MKGVLRARARRSARRSRRGGPQRCGPLLFTVICLHLLIQDAENAILPSLAAIIETAHGSSKSDENACKTPDIG